MYLTISKE